MGEVIDFPTRPGSVKDVIDSIAKGRPVVFWFHDCATTGRKGMRIIRGFACRDCGAIAVGHHLGPHEDLE